MSEEKQDTRGLTQRELILELRGDVKNLLMFSVSRRELYTVVGLASTALTIAIGVVAL